MVASRWLDDAWWPEIQKGFFGSFPALLRGPIGFVARRSMRQTYDLHGMGRHTLEEQKGFAGRDLEAIDGLVAVRPFLLGENISVYDFGVASLLAGLLDNKPPTWLTALAETHTHLRPYAERVQESVGVWCRER
jgi:glutathione S-transferase